MAFNMEKILQMLHDDMHKLSQMNKILLEAWQDDLSEHFKKGCLEAMERQWKQYWEAIIPLCKEVSKMEKEIQNYREGCRKR